MSETVVYGLIVVGLAVSAGALWFIVRLLGEQKARKEENQRRLEEVARKAQEHRAYLVESLQVIAQTLMNDEMSVIEGSIRCRMLLDNLDPQLCRHDDFVVFSEVYEKTRHIPRLKEWKALKTKQKLPHMQLMDEVENEHKEAILTAAGKLRQHPFDRYH